METYTTQECQEFYDQIRSLSRSHSEAEVAQKLGFSRCVISNRNMKGLGHIDGMEVIGVNGICEALEALEVVG